MSPQRKAGTIFLRDGLFFCSQRIGYVFKRTLDLGFSMGRGSGFSFGLWTFGWFNTGIRFGFSDVGLVLLLDFDLLDYWFFKGTMDQVFLSDFGLLDGLTQEYGLVLLSDVGLVFTLRTLDWFFHFGRWML
jgi:hypothetical protein